MITRLQSMIHPIESGLAHGVIGLVHGVMGNAKTDGTTDLDRVFHRMERISAVGAMIGALEQIVRSSDLNDRGIFSWPLHRTRHAANRRFPRKQIGELLRYPQVTIVLDARLLAAGRLVFGNPGPPERALLLGTLCATGSGMHLRHHYGADGSDQLSQITFVVSLLEKAFPQDSRAREACLRFIAFQTCVSYATAGAVKLVSPQWRDGSAITGIFRTQAYGDATVHAWLKRWPGLAAVLAWTVIIGELTFPLVLVAPRRTAHAILAMSTAFHLANGRLMGLNRFLWAFTGTYPAVAHVSRALRP